MWRYMRLPDALVKLFYIFVWNLNYMPSDWKWTYKVVGAFLHL